MSKIYYQERNHPNWTGRVSRQSRITGQWSTDRKSPPPVWDIVACVAGAVAILFALML